MNVWKEFVWYFSIYIMQIIFFTKKYKYTLFTWCMYNKHIRYYPAYPVQYSLAPACRGEYCWTASVQHLLGWNECTGMPGRSNRCQKFGWKYWWLLYIKIRFFWLFFSISVKENSCLFCKFFFFLVLKSTIIWYWRGKLIQTFPLISLNSFPLYV